MQTVLHGSTRLTWRSSRLHLLALVPVAALLAACSSSAASSSDGSASGGAASSTAIPAALTSYFPGKAATGTEISIGLINPEGGAAVSQPEDREAAQAATTYANEQLGGIAGHKIKLVVCKQKEDAATARDCANQMVQAGVAAVVIPTSAQGASMAPIITGAGIPYVSSGLSLPAELTADHAYSYSGGYIGTLISMAKYLAGEGKKSFTLYVTNSVVSATNQIGVPIFKAAGITLNVVSIPAGTADVTSQVSAGLVSKPDVVGIIGDATVCTSVLNGFGTAGVTVEKLVIQPCLDKTTIQAAGQYMNGAKVFTVNDVSSDAVESQLYRAVMAKYSPSTATEGYAVVGYQSLLGLVRATSTMTGDVTPATIDAAMKAAKNVPLPAGDGLTFTCDGTANPQLKALCAVGTIAGTYNDGKVSDFKKVQ